MQGKDVSLTGLSPGILPLLSFLLVLPLSHPLSLWRPSGPHHGSFCLSHMQGVSAYPARINQPVNVRIFVRVLIPLPSFFPCSLVPYTRELAPFTAPTPQPPLEWTSQGLNSTIVCLIAPALPWRTVSSKAFVKTQTEMSWLCAWS